MNLPKLYKLTSLGKVQEWEISTEGNTISITQGQKDGKKQHYEYTIKKGRNLGRSNETTPEQQANLEAKSKWDKKYGKSYHLSIDDCNQKVKIANAGGYLPMLAHSYKKHAKRHLKYPCYIQPKLDGIRCISTKGPEGVKLWFRSGKEITTMKHIINDLDFVMKEGDIFDGELYVHGGDFNSFAGAIRANKNLNSEAAKKIKYHIYDFPRINELKEKDTYTDRYTEFKRIALGITSLVRVETIKVMNFKKAMEIYKDFIDKGFEGVVFRNMEMPYKQKRSHDLLKYKEFVDDEFIIIGAEEGKGILAGHIGAFICNLVEGQKYNDVNGTTKVYRESLDLRPEPYKGKVRAKLKGKQSLLKHLFENPKEYLGKPLTIQYQSLSVYSVPRFPVGKNIRFDK